MSYNVMQFSKLIMFLGGALNATLTLLTELVMSGMKGMGFKDLFQVTRILLLHCKHSLKW